MFFKTLILILAVSVLIPNFISANDFVINNLKNEAFSESNFPYFSSDTYPQSATNINEFLQYDYFRRVFKQGDFASETLSPFKGGPGERHIYIYDYEVNKKTNYIQLSINTESCGAYCENYTNSYIFDIYTGQVITLVDLLSTEGLNSLEQKVRDINKKRIEPYLKIQLKTAGEREVEQYYTYQYCYDSRFKQNINSYNKVDQDTSFSLGDNELVISHERCSNHASRAIDDIGRFVNSFSFNDLQPYLTMDAKLYLSDKAHALPTRKTPYKIYHGKIANTYPITILRQRYGAWDYWYDKYKTPISLNSVETSKDNSYILQEGGHNVIDKWVYTSEFRVEENNGVFNGVFIRLRDGKEMDVMFK